MTLEGLHQNAENVLQSISRFSSLMKQRKALNDIIAVTKSKAEKNKSQKEKEQIELQLQKLKPFIINALNNIDKLCDQELKKNV